MELSLENKLLRAILRGDIEAVCRLLSKGANPNKTVSNGRTCLGEAAYSGYTEIVMELIAATQKDTTKPSSTEIPESITPTKSNSKSIKTLRKKRNKSNSGLNKTSIDDPLTKQGYYVIIHEEGSSSEEGKKGAFPMSPMSSPLELEWDHEEVNVAATTSEDESITDMYKWYAAILESTGAAIVAASDYTCGIDQQDALGRTALYYAVDEGHVDVVNALIQAGCKLDLAGSCGQSPLHLAVASRRIDVAKLLLDAGSNVNATTPKKTTPLHIAATRDLVMVTVLVENGALLDARDARDRTALYLAASKGKTDIVEFLILCGANTNIGDGDGHTPLCQAVFSKHHKTVEVLLTSGVRITHFQCLLHYAVRESEIQVEMFELLARHGCGINVHNSVGDTPLLMAMALSDPYPYAKILLENGANADACNSHTGARVLHVAVEYNTNPEEFERLLLLLLHYNVDIDKRAATRDTPLNRAILLHKDKIATQLIRHGADVNACDMFNNVFGNLIIASHRKTNRLANMLLKAGHRRIQIEVGSNLNRTAEWINEQCRSPQSLIDICRIRVRKLHGKRMLVNLVSSLPVPDIIKRYLVMDELT